MCCTPNNTPLLISLFLCVHMYGAQVKTKDNQMYDIAFIKSENII